MRACLVLVSRGLLARQGYKLIVKAPQESLPKVLGSIVVVSYLEGFSRRVRRILLDRGVSHRLVELSWKRDDRLETALRKAFSEKPAGVIIWAASLDESSKPLLQAAKIPIVVSTAGRIPPYVSSVQIDWGAEKAVRHLQELGHRDLAFVAVEKYPELVDPYQEACHKLGLPQSASRIWQIEGETFVDQFLEEHFKYPKVTAIVAPGPVAARIIQIVPAPRKLSVVGIDLAGTETEAPSLTRIVFRDPEAVPSLSCSILISHMETLQSRRPAKPPTQIVLMPELLVRESTQALIQRKRIPAIAEELSSTKSHPLSTWQNIYPFLKKKRSASWLELDLSKLVNHSMKRQNGWLGAQPLEHFPPCLRSIHGVPFRILDEDQNDGRAVITFRSPHSHSAGKRRLPARVRLAMDSCVKALYFLHGCGNASPGRFAEYVMHYEDGGAVSVPLVAMGSSHLSASDRPDALKPNIQDWWPTGYDQRDYPHAHRVIIFDPANPGDYERFLYSLEWINPRPEVNMSFIEVNVDPSAGPTLALLAVTALL